MDLSSDEADDWFMESLRMYNDLHEFHLEHPTKVIEWTGEKSVCVAGFSGARNEILEMLLPLKLYAGGKQGLCPERDFKVLHGGLCDEAVECLRHITGTRCVVTSGPSSSRLHIWDIGGDENDIIKKSGVINCNSNSVTGQKIASGLTDVPSVLHGSKVSDIQLTELSTGRVLHAVAPRLTFTLLFTETASSDPVSALQFLNANQFVIGASNGTVYMGDVRDPKVTPYVLKESVKESSWTLGLSKVEDHSDPFSCSVARLSSSGQVLVSDLRNLSSPVRQARIHTGHTVAHCDFLNVTWSPSLVNCLAVSGFDGTVCIFDTTCWSADPQTPEPLFVHRGHNSSCEKKTKVSPLVVTTHVWHPQRPRTLLSAASDGSMHVWDWIEKSNGCC